MEVTLIPSIVVVVISVGGVIGGYFTSKAKIDFLQSLLAELRGDHESALRRNDAMEKKAYDLELRIEREFVKKYDLQDVESRIGKRLEGVETSVNKRLDGVEHTVKNSMTQILGAVTGAVAGAVTERARPRMRPQE